MDKADLIGEWNGAYKLDSSDNRLVTPLYRFYLFSEGFLIQRSFKIPDKSKESIDTLSWELEGENINIENKKGELEIVKSELNGDTLKLIRNGYIEIYLRNKVKNSFVQFDSFEEGNLYCIDSPIMNDTVRILTKESLVHENTNRISDGEINGWYVSEFNGANYLIISSPGYPPMKILRNEGQKYFLKNYFDTEGEIVISEVIR
ncbi:MAG: hypothetical protein MK105_12445 [Crocinitomicaceae bacterium]|nr:hypothetical protein [Crocinitomicaceae bacterium]